MKKKLQVFFAASLVTGLSGCASITPPPERIDWDTAPSSTVCTDDESVLTGQYAGSLLAAILGGADIGAGLAYGQISILGFGLAGVGLYGANDVDKKLKEIEKCNEFKQYIALRDVKNAKTPEKELSLEKKLSELTQLLEKGVITQEEHDKSRERLLTGGK